MKDGNGSDEQQRTGLLEMGTIRSQLGIIGIRFP
jgi:hypothetical protein